MDMSFAFFWSQMMDNPLLMLAVLILPNQLQANAATLDWVLDSDGTLTISGSGPMEFDWNAAVRVPWSPYAAQIKKVVIGEGVTSIADSAFYECANLQEVQLPDSLRYIYHQAFGDCTSLTGITIPAGVEELDLWAFSGSENLFLLYAYSLCQKYGMKEGIPEIRCKCIVDQRIELLRFFLQIFQICCVFLLQFRIQLMLGLDKLIHDFQFSAVKH